ncbi:tetratricopeptide repeat protein [Aquimarina sp. AD10]|uniref:tetratricopeptide repeat-containing sensor histidine kinase n=1 Tax=Aquimarina sp. AD10 TaxID=1714849 RepID=UPI000E4DDBFE|nr:tetratricopeptide repeat protein [Aquimarina sp. AD10]AXT58809.1 tetratricopeptide repeat protein [Aquimarina sp. AD10]RKM99715.1 tetratricopeptide repeat protein [Aquimarina sp. AD10]
MKKACLTFVLLLVSYANCISQEHILDDIIPEIKTLSDTLHFEKARREVQNLFNNKESDKALTYSNTLLEISKHIGYDKGIGDMHNQIGTIYNSVDQSVKAFRHYEMAAVYFNKIKYTLGLATTNNNRAIIEQKRGNFEKSAEYLLESNTQYEREQDSVGLSNSFNNLGNVYAALGDFESAKKYYNKSIIIKKKKRLDRVGIMMNNLALLYIDNKKADSAKSILLESLDIGKKDNNSRSMAQSYSILAKVALFNKDYKTAKKYYDSTLVTGKIAQWKPLLINAKQQLGLIAIETKDFKKAENLLSTSRREFAALGMTPLLLKNYQYAAKLDSAKGNFAGAFVWQKRYQELSNQSSSEATARKIEKTESHYKAELEQLKVIDAQEKRERQTKETLFTYRLLAFISIGIFLIISVFLIMIIRTRKERKRYIKELNESNEVKNKLFSIISHDLKNEIHGLEGSLNLMKEEIISTEEFKEIVPILANRTHQTSILLNNLLNWSKSQMKELNAQPTTFDIAEVIGSKFTFFKPKAEQKDIKLINKLDSTMIFADKDMFDIVAQNLIANAIKFCNPGDSIALLSKEKEDRYEICFQDTGVGIDPDHIHKLFAEDTFTTEGTQNETGTGLGLKICKELIELNKGEIKVESTPGEGSIFSISLPKAA